MQSQPLPGETDDGETPAETSASLDYKQVLEDWTNTGLMKMDLTGHKQPLAETRR